jgi:hypothetical protein
MPVDLNYLREHYASLSDDALRAVKRADLVDAAQKLFDQEVARRRQTRPTIPVVAEPAADDPETDEEVEEATGDEPDWLDEAAEVLSRYASPASVPSDDIMDAEQALEAAGIPCYLELFEEREEQSSAPRPTHRWRLLVPGNVAMRATSVLERDISNSEFEAGWRAQLEALSDEELREMTPAVAFCGLFDRVERVTKAYEEEIARRRLDRQRR